MFIRCNNGEKCDLRGICKRFDKEGINNGKNIAAFFNKEEKCMNFITLENDNMNK